MMDTKEFLIRCIENEFKNIIDIMRLYYKIYKITTFVLDIQLYSNKEETEPTEARIWLSDIWNVGTVRDYGIHLQLYSIKLKDSENKITDHKQALEIFNAYMNYYALNQDKFKALEKSKKGQYNPTFDIKFEVSNR